MTPATFSEARRLVDAKPGDRLVDRDGDVWERTVEGVTVHFVGPKSSGGSPESGPESWFDEAEEHFGPFTLAVGEVPLAGRVQASCAPPPSDPGCAP